ncbi:unnamed protein product [Ectocarpus sp. 12 AP-2014]
MFRVFAIVFLLIGSSAFADSNNKIPLNREVNLKVGQSIIVHGYRGDCGERPKNVDPKRTRKTKLGVLSNGKWGVTKSTACGGWTPAVEVIYKARKKGSEIIEVRGTKIKVSVR